MDSNNFELDENKGIKRQYFAAISACMIAFLYGCDLGWVSPFLPLLMSKETPLDQPLSLVQIAALGSFICIGGLIGTPILGFVSDKWGRRVALLISIIPILISWILKMTCLTSNGLLVARILSGFSGAAAYLVVPTYCVEIASPSTRGILGSFLAFELNIGIVSMYLIGVYVSYNNTVIILLVLAFLALIFIYIAPESPVFYVKQSQYENAAKSIAWLRSESIHDPNVNRILERLKSENKLSGNDSEDRWDSKIPAYKHLYSGPISRAFAVCFALLTIQCFTGMFAVITYANNIFELSNSKLSPGSSTILIGVLQLIGSVIASSLIERTGRRILLITSCAIISLGMAVIGIYFCLMHSKYALDGLGWIPATALSFIVTAFSIGLAPIPFLLPSELIPIKARGLATTLLIMSFWILSFVVVVIFNALEDTIGIHAAFWMFAIGSGSGVVVTLLFLPETKGASFKTILDFYTSKKEIVNYI